MLSLLLTTAYQLRHDDTATPYTTALATENGHHALPGPPVSACVVPDGVLKTAERKQLRLYWPCIETHTILFLVLNKMSCHLQQVCSLNVNIPVFKGGMKTALSVSGKDGTSRIKIKISTLHVRSRHVWRRGTSWLQCKTGFFRSLSG